MKKLLLAGFLSIAALLQARAQSPQFQFPTTPWGGFAPGEIQCGELLGANFNITTDQIIPIAVPSATWSVSNIQVSNPSISLTTAVGGVYSAASKGGVAVVANSQVYSGLTTNAANTTGNYLILTLAAAGSTTAFQGPTQTSPIKALYFSLTTAQGAAATGDIRVRCRPLF